MSKNTNLNKAKENKNDEFYTRLEDIEKELIHYEESFKDKVVYCNCDDPRWSQFVKYFEDNYDRLQLKGLLVSYLKPDGTGDFRSDESIELLKQADIVVTNPPFSLARAYIEQLFEYEKKFIIIGTLNMITYNTVFRHIVDGTLWSGYTLHGNDIQFGISDHYTLDSKSIRVDENGNRFVRFSNIRWYTNLEYAEEHHELVMTTTYNPIDYPKYDDYDAINVNKIADIPCDYYHTMAVPITFIDKHAPQFEIIGYHNGGNKDFTIDGKYKYGRIHIRRIQP